MPAKMKNFSPSSIAAVFLMLWMWLMTIAIIELFKMSDREPDLAICPLCDQTVMPSSNWKLHPETP